MKISEVKKNTLLQIGELFQMTGNILTFNLDGHLVILMAGGLGRRLWPLTANMPKPLLKVCNKPILEIALERFIAHGFKDFLFIINYQSNKIKKYFGNGSAWGVKISYLTEKKKMGTAGGLSLLPEKPAKSFLVMNGDILTRIDFRLLLLFHQERRAAATMCVREYRIRLPYGVVQIDNQKLLAIKEKPEQICYVNAGIYVLEPEVIQFIPKNKLYNMTDLFDFLIGNGLNTAVFPVSDYWIDIGCLEDLKKANADCLKFFGHESVRSHY